MSGLQLAASQQHPDRAQTALQILLRRDEVPRRGADMIASPWTCVGLELEKSSQRCSAANARLVAWLEQQPEDLDGYPIRALMSHLINSLECDAHERARVEALVSHVIGVWIATISHDIEHFPRADTTTLVTIKGRLGLTRDALIDLRRLIGQLERPAHAAPEAARAYITATA